MVNKSTLKEGQIKVGDELICFPGESYYYKSKRGKLFKVSYNKEGKLIVDSTLIFSDSSGNTNNNALGKFNYIKATKLAKILYAKI
jgi:hypothetical protein